MRDDSWFHLALFLEGEREPLDVLPLEISRTQALRCMTLDLDAAMSDENTISSSGTAEARAEQNRMLFRVCPLE